MTAELRHEWISYLRVSTAEQAERDLSLPAQRRAVEDYAARHGATIAREYVEAGCSGMNARRKAFRQMLEDVMRPNSTVGTVVVHHTSRFTRDATEARLVKQRFRKAGVRVVSVTPKRAASPMTLMPPSKVAKYDPELSASLVTKAKALVATPDSAFSFPDMHAVDLAIRLASERHEITNAVIAAYAQDAFSIKAREAITALADQLEAAGMKARESNKWYDEAHELRSRLKRSDAVLAAAGAPMDELLTDQGAEWIRRTLDAIALQLDAAQVDRTLPLVVQVEALRNERDGLRKDQLFVTARCSELETKLANVTSLCAKAQRDRDFFRSEAEERGRELRALQLIPRVHEES